MSAIGLLIWWTTGEERALIGDHGDLTEFPEWLVEEIRSSIGRNGRGRLWASEKLHELVPPPGFLDLPFIDWDEGGALSRHCEECAGIVITADVVKLLAKMPGVITDFNLRRSESR